MTCRTVMVLGRPAIVCDRKRPRRCACGAVASLQCDWKMPEDFKRKTCDEWLCREHGKEVATDKHLCPIHTAAYRAWLKKRGKG